MPSLKTLGAIRGITSGVAGGLELLREREEREEEKRSKSREKAEQDFKKSVTQMDMHEALDYAKKYNISEYVFGKYKHLIGDEKNVDLQQLQRIMNPDKDMYPVQTKDFAIAKDGQAVFAKSPTEEQKRGILATTDFATDKQRSMAEKAYLPSVDKKGNVDLSVVKARQISSINAANPKDVDDINEFYKKNYGLEPISQKPAKPTTTKQSKENAKQLAAIKNKKNKNISERNRLLRGFQVITKDELSLDDPEEKKVFDLIETFENQNATLDSMEVELSGDPTFEYKPQEFNKKMLGKKEKQVKAKTVDEIRKELKSKVNPKRTKAIEILQSKKQPVTEANIKYVMGQL